MDLGPFKELGNNENFNCLYGFPRWSLFLEIEKAPMPLDADCAAATENMLIERSR